MDPNRLVVLASTYPRWPGDEVPAFVHEFAQHLGDHFASVSALVPDFPGAARTETMDGVEIRRFTYWWPRSGQSIAYGRFKPSLLSKVKGGAYTVALMAAAVRAGRSAGVVNAHWLVPQGFAAVAASRLTGTRTVIVVHGADVFTLTGGLSRRLKAWTLRHADRVVANSSATLAACRELHERDDYAVIPMGTVDRYDPTPAPPSDAVRLAFVGRLADGKGVDDAIRAVGEARARGVAARLEIAGDGVMRDDLEALVDALDLRDHVTFLGWMTPDQLPAILARNDALVGPSHTTEAGWKEAFGLVFVEAALAGRPAIGTRSGGISDIIEDGVTGYLVDERAVTQIADAIADLAADRDRALAMGAAARERALDQFTWDAIARRYAEVMVAGETEQARA
ncbi:glycosyltransferase [Demequina soli]|uniref:glycosyltransferase n=1 Tax=Demequina soli TaxID=1638987 RepID=UPI0007821C4E|nr:glycosyltransferase [Demequina soli]